MEAIVVILAVIIIVYTGKHNIYKILYIILYSFNVDTFNWKALSPTTSHHGPMMKADSSIVPLEIKEEAYLTVIGGYGSSSNNTPPQPGAQYNGKGLRPDRQRCNEVHMHRLKTGQYNMILGL